MTHTARTKILFLCTGNSCRSQIAEGWARHLRSDSLEAHSAGTAPHGVNPMAVRVMKEAGVDISTHRSKDVSKLLSTPFDYVITLCGGARETCPVFPREVKCLHVGFDDPPALAQAESGEEEAQDIYRRVRDEIRAFVETLPDGLRTLE